MGVSAAAACEVAFLPPRPGTSRGGERSFRTLSRHGKPGAESLAGEVGPSASAAVERVLSSPGAPLNAGIRATMEDRFAHDFSLVRVHTDGASAAAADAVRARAFTVGPHVVFGEGEYRPAERDGRALIAHELAHVVQHAGALAGSSPNRISRASGDPQPGASITVEPGCPGNEATIYQGLLDARLAARGIADPQAQRCILDALAAPHIVCTDGEGCGGGWYWSDTIYIHEWLMGCPPLAAVILHEASHKCRYFGSEAFAEACEAEAFPTSATPPEAGEEGGKCEI